MKIQFSCPQCGEVIRVPEAAAGKKAQCKQCSEIFRIPPPQISVAATPSVPQPAVEVEPEPQPELNYSEDIPSFEEEEEFDVKDSFAPLPLPRRSDTANQPETSPPEYLLLLISGWTFIVIAVLILGFALLTIVLTLVGAIESQESLTGGLFAVSGLVFSMPLFVMSVIFGAIGQVIFAFRDIARNTHYLRFRS